MTRSLAARRGRLKVITGLLALGALLVVAVSAYAHQQSFGGGNDIAVGHDHNDVFLGNAGCDDLLMRGGADEAWGGPNGCDFARGETGNSDASIVCDDGLGNDHAFGGGGSGDVCYAGGQDIADFGSCEFVNRC